MDKPKSKNKKNNKSNNNNMKTVSAPAAQSKVVTVRGPQMKGTPEGRIIIKHREFVDEFFQPAGLLIKTSFEVNPVNKFVFPWLSKVAKAFDNFKFRKFNVEWITSCPTSASGQYLLAYDPSPKPIADISIRKLGGQTGAKEMPVWANRSIKATQDQLNSLPRYYIGHNFEKGTTYNAGHFYLVHSSSQPADNLVGSMWVDYEVELYNPTAEAAECVGGRVSIVGSGDAMSGAVTFTSGTNYKFKYMLGAFQGPKLPPGQYLVKWTVSITGGGTCTSLTPAMHSVDGAITELGEYLGTLSTSLFSVVIGDLPLGETDEHSGQLNCGLTTSGTVTTITHTFHIAEAPELTLPA